MSSWSSFGLYFLSRNSVVRSCRRQGILHGTYANVWTSSLVFLLILLTLFLSAHSQILDELSQNRLALNRQIYYEAFRSLNSFKIRTGDVYNSTLPGNITDISVELIQMVRLRTGSLRRYGFKFNEISLPVGVEVVQTIRCVILVYRRFREYRYYDTTLGNMFVAPVVGILVYNAGDITNYTDYIRPELTIMATERPIEVHLQSSRNPTLNYVTCIMYNNTVGGTSVGVVKNFTAPSFCSWSTLGDYSLLAASEKGSNNTWKIVLGSAAGAAGLVVLLAVIVLLSARYRERAKFANMDRKSEQGEILHHTLIGGSWAPAAASTRTKPALENDNLS